MEIIITEWGLESYLNLRDKATFSEGDYKNILRPDVLLLREYPASEKFENGHFWGPATDRGEIIKHGFKMKWHNIGNGNNQLRLCVVIAKIEIKGVEEERAFLCTAYVKDDKSEKREMQRIYNKIDRIFQGKFEYRGSL